MKLKKMYSWETIYEIHLKCDVFHLEYIVLMSDFWTKHSLRGKTYKQATFLLVPWGDYRLCEN